MTESFGSFSSGDEGLQREMWLLPVMSGVLGTSGLVAVVVLMIVGSRREKARARAKDGLHLPALVVGARAGRVRGRAYFEPIVEADLGNPHRRRDGRTQAEKDRERAERERAARSIEGKRLERDREEATTPAAPSEEPDDH